MNCLEFRRAKLADPRRLADPARQHVSACPACQSFARRIDEGELGLEKALQVAVPDGLADRVLLRVLRNRRTARWSTLQLLALAATVLACVGVGMLWFQGAPGQEHARMAIEHVMHEPESFTTTKNADAKFFRQVMQEFGGEVKEPLGQVRYIKLCPVPEGTGWHIVFETEGGLTTLLLIPNQRPRRASEAATIGGWNALALPGGRGFYAIITDSPERTMAFSERLSQSVRWKA